MWSGGQEGFGLEKGGVSHWQQQQVAAKVTEMLSEKRTGALECGVFEGVVAVACCDGA